jgi:hypothetical protein
MFTLAHAHGTLLALVNLAAGLTARAMPDRPMSASACSALRASAVLLPLGFFLGGWAVHGGDPGIGVLLVPVGAVLLLYGVGRIAWEMGRVR